MMEQELIVAMDIVEKYQTKRKDFFSTNYQFGNIYELMI
jgi:hypothetical protein